MSNRKIVTFDLTNKKKLESTLIRIPSKRGTIVVDNPFSNDFIQINTTDMLYHLIFRSFYTHDLSSCTMKSIINDHLGYAFIALPILHNLTTITTFTIQNENKKNISHLIKKLHIEMHNQLVSENKHWNSKKKINTPLIIGMMKSYKRFNETIQHSVTEDDVTIHVSIQITAYRRTYVDDGSEMFSIQQLFDRFY